ncbi:hypothetical protein [uncultured Roseobacter sp.]|uniref:hypothetical protein n=1 Tax=uncultured Roseobacter sp. TaxID=114847 RepID=UPI002617074B|nr:hypothetical protein [uncultured Roseobacter sp.]
MALLERRSDCQKPGLERLGVVGPSATVLFAKTVLLMVLLAHCFIGIDLTDEIQYYYQIEGLLRTGTLFATDLYVQQLIYILFYPVLKLYHSMFGVTGLVLFGRLLFAGLLLLLFAFSRRQFVRRGLDDGAACFASVALVLAVPYHGIFAISYNTISQIGWALTMLFVVCRVHLPMWVWALVISITGLAHPTAGIAVSVISGLFFVTQDRIRELLGVIAYCIVFSLILISLVFVLGGGISGFWTALAFSGGFSVGTALLSERNLFQYSQIAALVLGAMFLPTSRIAVRPLLWTLVALLAVSIIYGIQTRLTWPADSAWPYRYKLEFLDGWVILSAIALFALRCVQREHSVRLPDARALGLITLFQCAVLSATSSNGLAQGIGAFSLALPILTAGLVLQVYHPRQWTRRIPAVLVAALAVSMSLLYPYQQSSLVGAQRTFAEAPLFRGLLVTSEQDDFFHQAREQLAKQLPSRTGMILSRTPGLYAILNIAPQGCMVYNHSMRSERSEEAFFECMDQREIDFVFRVRWLDRDDRFAEIASKLTELRGFTCRELMFEPSSPPRGLSTMPLASLCD